MERAVPTSRGRIPERALRRRFDVRKKKTKAVEIFEDATFKLHKWHSNVETLESDERNSKENAVDDYQSTFAKQ